MPADTKGVKSVVCIGAREAEAKTTRQYKNSTTGTSVVGIALGYPLVCCRYKKCLEARLEAKPMDAASLSSKIGCRFSA